MTKTIAWFQCSAGVSGDMCLGALIAAGAPLDTLQKWLSELGLPAQLTVEAVQKQGIAAIKAQVTCAHEHQHRHLSHIESLIDAAPSLPQPVKVQSKKVFHRLAEAEAAVHNSTPEEVHFHEVGAADAIFDICGTVAALYLLDVQEIYFAPLPLSHGFVDCAHGRLPLPAPATAKLLEGLKVFPLDVAGETVTPTGAALLNTLGVQKSFCPAFRLIAQGYGAGEKDFAHANVLQVYLGETSTPSENFTQDEITVLTSALDDGNPEFLGGLWQKLFAAGALDVFYRSLYMKKGRPGVELTVLAPTEKTEALAQLIFCETTTIGLRYHKEHRFLQPRCHFLVSTPWGTVPVKKSGQGLTATLAPEYEACQKLSQESSLPVKTIYQAALAAAWQQFAQEAEKHD